MLRFLKRRLEKSRKSSPKSEDPIGVECGRDSDGEHLSFEKDLTADEADGIDSVIVPDINDGGCSRIATQGGRIGNQQLPAPNPDDKPAQASSVPCERLFSSGKETCTARRNRLQPHLMEALQA